MIVLSLVLVIVAAVTLVLGVFQDGLTLIYVSIGTCLAAMVLLGIGVLMRRREDSEPATASSGYGPGAQGASAQDGQSARDEDEVQVREAQDTAQLQPAKKAVVKKVSATPAVPQRDATEEQPATGQPAGQKPASDRAADTASAAGAAGAAGAADGDAGTDAGTPAASGGDGDAQTSEVDPEVAVSAPVKKVAAKKVAAKKVAAKKVTAKKVTAKKTTAGESTTPATATPSAADGPASEATAADAPAAAATAKKATAKKAAKKSTAKKTTAKKAAKKSTAKKTTARKAATPGAGSLPDLKGLGPAKKKALLDEFGSVENIRSASVSDLASVRGVGAGLAEALKRELGG